ncbi:MAG TPA: hypothetical protein VMS37_29400 [Verrucomicrobiae bacterium]|nr:hypothetical protein [Verrucomicrobiae bacterium]
MRFALIMVLAGLACAQGGPAGHWEGTLPMNGREIGLTLDLAQNAKSEWIGSMGVASANATGLVVMDIAVNGASVKFIAVELQMARFELTLGPDGILKGTVTNAQRSAPVEFKRTGEAKVELIPPSPAVSKELEGDWEGSLTTPNRVFPLVVHFRNQPDKTVAATMDSPDANAMHVPLNDVKQTGQSVDFGIKVAHSSFHGTLNKEGTEITGAWTHETDSMPLTLRKK